MSGCTPFPEYNNIRRQVLLYVVHIPFQPIRQMLELSDIGLSQVVTSVLNPDRSIFSKRNTNIGSINFFFDNDLFG